MIIVDYDSMSDATIQEPILSENPGDGFRILANMIADRILREGRQEENDQSISDNR